MDGLKVANVYGVVFKQSRVSPPHLLSPVVVSIVVSTMSSEGGVFGETRTDFLF